MSQYPLRILVWAGLSLAGAALPGAQVLQGCLRPEFAAAPRTGDLDPATPLTLELGLPLPDPAALDAFIATLYDPHSGNYRRFLTPAAFARRFGPSPADYQALLDFALAQGLSVSATHTSRLLLELKGRADRIERVFHVRLGRRLRTDGSAFFAPDSAPSVDLNLPGLTVSGLDNFARHRSRARRHPRPSVAPSGPRPRDGSGGDSTYGWAYQGYDFRDAYVPGVAQQGSGQNIGLVEFGGYYYSDITTYAATSNPPLPSNPSITTVAVDGGVSSPTNNGDTSTGGPENDCSEVSLDIEMAMAMAPQAGIVVYEAPYASSLSSILAAMADSPICNQISCSWGDGDMGSNAAALLSQLASQGQAFFNASGDDGAYASNDPAGPVGEPDSLSPYITEVGGTNLNTAGPSGNPVTISYASENVWNDYQGTCAGVSNGCADCYGGAGGGGVCDGNSPSSSPNLYSPSYQSGVSMAGNGGSTIYRDIPDVSAVAENFWVVYCGGCPAVHPLGESAGQQQLPFDGTSGAAPLWAAFEALVNEQAASEGKGPLGFADVALYSVAKGSDYSADFNDIADGSNNNIGSDNGLNCDPTYYSAVTGYDLATGWGSPKGQSLIQDLVGTLSSPTVTSTFSATPTASDSPTVTATFSASPTVSDSPTATPSFSASPTASPSPTATNSPTATPSFSASPTVTQTFTRTRTPAYLASPFGRSILAPVPARKGEPVTLYFSAPPAWTRWQVYNIVGRRVAALSIQGSGPHSLSTQGLASGVYWARVTVGYASGASQVLMLKFAVIR